MLQDYPQQTISQSGVPLSPPSEGWWAVLLTVILVTMAIGTGTLLGVGTWRVVHDKAPLADLKDESVLLQANASALFDDVQVLVVPENCTFYVGNQTQPNEYPSDEFFVYSASDSDLQVDFDTSALSSTDRFLQIQNASGVVAYLDNVTGLHSTFVDNTFRLQHAADSTKKAYFELGGLNPMQLLTLSIQTTGGTIAYLTDTPTQITDYADDEFVLETWEASDNTTLMFDASAIGSNLTQILTVQDKSGTIAYLADVNSLDPVMIDDTFAVFHEGSSTSKTRFELSGLDSPSNVTLTFQGRSGTIAYVGDIPPPGFFEVDITTDRQFPDMTHENANTLQDLGVTHMQIWMCGGGGAGASYCKENGGVFTNYGDFFIAGGGAGGAIDGLIIRNVSGRYTHLNVVLGNNPLTTMGQVTYDVSGTTFVSRVPVGGNGGNTVVTGVPIDTQLDPMELIGYGGGGGNGYSVTGDEKYGGCGGGSASRGLSTEETYDAGEAGLFGGVSGACGNQIVRVPVVPAYRFPWRGGSHGSGKAFLSSAGSITCIDEDVCGSSDMVGGGSGGFPPASTITTGAGGGGGLFGPGGTPSSPNAPPNSCAGGGASPIGNKVVFSGFTNFECQENAEELSRGRGGAGRVFIRYWTA